MNFHHSTYAAALGMSASTLGFTAVPGFHGSHITHGTPERTHRTPFAIQELLGLGNGQDSDRPRTTQPDPILSSSYLASSLANSLSPMRGSMLKEPHPSLSYSWRSSFINALNSTPPVFNLGSPPHSSFLSKDIDTKSSKYLFFLF